MKTNRLTRKLNKWLKENGFDVRCKPGEDFYSYIYDNTIHYSFLYSEKDAEIFNRPFLKSGINADQFITTFFHELGHLMTADEITDKEWEEYRKFKHDIEYKEDADESDVEAYMTCYVEMKATNWAINYILNNVMKVKEFWEDIREEIIKYYDEVLKETEKNVDDFNCCVLSS